MAPVSDYESITAPVTAVLTLTASRSNGSNYNLTAPVIIFVFPKTLGGVILLHPPKPPKPGTIKLPTIKGLNGVVRPAKRGSLCVAIIRKFCPPDAGGSSSQGGTAPVDPQTAPEGTDPELLKDPETPSTTTASATSTSSDLNLGLCSPDSETCNLRCGQEVAGEQLFSPPKEPRSLQHQLRKRVMDDPPAGYTGLALKTWIFNRFLNALEVERIPRTSPTAPDHPSSLTITLLNAPGKVKLLRLHGCVSVVVYSRKRIWISHIWETNLLYTVQSLFTLRHSGSIPLGPYFNVVLDFLANGNTRIHHVGLQRFLGYGQDFGPEMNVHAFIIASSPKRFNLNLPNGMLLLNYDNFVGAIAAKLYQIFANHPGFQIHPAVYYWRKHMDEEETGRTAAVFFEYDPRGYDCQPQLCRARIWLDDPPGVIYEDTWPAYSWQIVRLHGREIGAACPISLRQKPKTIEDTGTKPTGNGIFLPDLKGNGDASSNLGSSPRMTDLVTHDARLASLTAKASSDSPFPRHASRLNSYMSESGVDEDVDPIFIGGIIGGGMGSGNSTQVFTAVSATKSSSIIATIDTLSAVDQRPTIDTSSYSVKSTSVTTTRFPHRIASIHLGTKAADLTKDFETSTSTFEDTKPPTSVPPSSLAVLTPTRTILNRPTTSRSNEYEQPHLAPLPPAYASGRCSIRLRQGLGTDDFMPWVFLSAIVVDAEGNEIGRNKSADDWDIPLYVTPEVLAPTLIVITPRTGIKNGRAGLSPKHRKRAKSLRAAVDDEVDGEEEVEQGVLKKRVSAPPPPRILFQKGPVEFVVTAVKGRANSKIDRWSTGTEERCSVGNWDNGNANDFFGSLIFGDVFIPNRQVRCGFEC